MRLFILLLTCSFLFACSSKKTNNDDSTSEIKEEISNKPFDFDTLVGIYEGSFDGNPIQINIKLATKHHAVGYNNYKGMIRNVSGKVVDSVNHVIMRLEEPGDNQFDGVFELVIDKENLKVDGKWSPFKGNLTSKKIKLEKLPDEEYEEGKINRRTIYSDFYTAADSLGKYRFSQDGSVTFEYYETQDQENYVDQKELIKGNWTLKGTTVTIMWEPNTIFPSRKSVYEVKEVGDEYKTYNLVNKENSIHPYDEY